MKALSIVVLLALLVSPCTCFSETWDEFLKLKASDEGKAGQIPKGPGKLIPKDIIVEQLKRQGEAVFESDCISFDFGSWRVTETSMAQLAEIAAALTDSRLKDSRFFYVDGHACAIGSDENNCRLSTRRAQSVVELLVSPGGVPASKLVSRGFGERMPKFSNETEETRRHNRRVVLRSAYEATPEEKRLQCVDGGVSQTTSSPEPRDYQTGGTEATVEEKGAGTPRGFKRIDVKEQVNTKPKGGSSTQGVFKEIAPAKPQQGGETDDAAPKGFKRVK